MAFATARLVFVPLSPPTTTSKPHVTAFPKLPLCSQKNPHSLPLAAASSSSSRNKSPPPVTAEKDILDSAAAFDASGDSCPAIRTYENDLARLTLLGAVNYRQALTAAAADGGSAADEHLSSGMATMVVETLFPGPSGDHSTVATRLVLPARKVKERSIELKKRLLRKELFSGTTQDNILAMTFRQVVVHHLQSVELEVFSPLTERNMNDLGNPREVSVAFTLSSMDEQLLGAIGEVVCAAAFRDTKSHTLHDSTNGVFGGLFSWLDKRKQVSSRGHSVVLYNFLEHEILANGKFLLEKFNSERGKHKLKGPKLKSRWWMPTAFSKLEKIGGREFLAWASEVLPAYILEIASDKYSDVEFGGWKKTDGNGWQVILTHSQMVNLADVLDMYYEDIFTLPNKRLPCYAAVKPSDLDNTKSNSFLKMLSCVFVSGILLVTISVLGKLFVPHLPINFVQQKSQASLSDVILVPDQSLEIPELETCYVSIIRKIKESFGWPDEIRIKSGPCAWIGELPKFIREMDDRDSSKLDISSISVPLAENEVEKQALEDIGSYQVVVSSEGDILGFQPTNRVAVNNWSSNPLAKVLHGGKNLSPGFFEPGLKISRPSGVLVLELLMSLNPKSYFAMVRAVDVSGTGQADS
ncbi:hypothetical protein STAS_07786 [Striga asiatica]|uniref:Uncharacterized protein n=1 Tax=Striga asiatica TaxID=4170 RepID=A0A5A7PGC3_STRAF|nr:hypothetical protein STAS_07786 [Striga asiatica]